MEQPTRKRLPNDKGILLDKESGYEVFSHDIMRTVFPRIFREANDLYNAKGMKKKPQIRDAAIFYFLLLSYTNGVPTKGNGDPNERFGACWLSYPEITKRLCIDKSRIVWLAKILEANGLIRKEKISVNMRWEVRYYPSWAPKVSAEGYLVDENGERIAPDPELYLP